MPAKIIFSLLISAFVISACANNPAPTAPPPATGAANATPTAAPSPIVFSRTGGFVGVNDQLTIDPNGHAKLVRRSGQTEFDLSKEQVSALSAAFTAAGFATLAEAPSPFGVAADAFSYSITYQGRTVKVADNTAPEKLKPLLMLLSRLVDSGGK